MDNGILHTIKFMVKKYIHKNTEKGRAPLINEIKYYMYMYMQMKHEEYYAEIDQNNE